MPYLLDYSPLRRRAGLRRTMKAVLGNPMLLVAAMIAVLLIAIPLIALIVMLANGTPDPGGFVSIALLVVTGGYLIWDLARRAGGQSALVEFARANGLEETLGQTRPDYGGSPFADSSHLVYQSVRTPGDRFTEVGEYLRSGMPPRGETKETHLFVRTRVGDGASARPYVQGVHMPSERHEELVDFAGEYRVELAPGGEVTFFGTKPLKPLEQGRVERAFSVADQLAEAVGASPVTYDRSAEVVPEAALRWGPILRVAGLFLLVLIGGPLLFALVMSVLDDYVRGDKVMSQLAVAVVAGVFILLLGWFFRWLTKRRR